MNARRTARLVGLLAAAPLLLWLDGWIPTAAPRAPGAAPPPPEISRALTGVAEDLSRRARALADDPEIARSLEGGGIAVRRQALFAGARKAMEGAAAGSWIALADPQGKAHAWWGDAPEQIPETRRPGTLAVRWSTTRFELLHWRVVGSGAFAGIICAGRSLPAEAPDFARALDLEGLSLDWEPASPGLGGPTLLATSQGEALIAGRPSDVPIGTSRLWRRVVLGLLAAIGLVARVRPVRLDRRGPGRPLPDRAVRRRGRRAIARVANSLASRRGRRRAADGARASAAREPDGHRPPGGGRFRSLCRRARGRAPRDRARSGLAVLTDERCRSCLSSP